MRGYQKKVIFLKNTGSHLFDEAYFVVSQRGEDAHIEQSDMVFEANRIIKESIGDEELRLREGGNKSKIDFFAPFFLGAFITVLIGIGVYFTLLK